MSEPFLEANFDGLVGPTHNYAGLGQGNVASQANRRKPANPRQAALQGLEKMRRVAALGVAQAVLPPQPRPDLEWLRALGFAGKDEQVVAKAARAEPELLAAAYSASAMWTANAATVSPSADCGDGRVHFTPANLASQIHRSVEPPHTAAFLKRLFPGPGFVHHAPLPAGRRFGDEGAANHIRLAPVHGAPGLEIFVHGGSSAAATGKSAWVTRKFLPRQTLEASRAVARLHGLDPERIVFLAQNPAAIDAGVFHNDVISTGNGNLLFCHQAAFADQAEALREIRRRYAMMHVDGPAARGPAGGGSLRIIEVTSREVPLATAVATYLFNCQMLTLPGGGTLLLAADECRRDARTRKYLEALPGRGLGITEIAYADLRQSMRNGGGPACLRLRAVLTRSEWDCVPPGVKFTEALYRRLRAWVESHYRDRLLPADLADPSLLKESRAAMRALDRILRLP
ncbi:MAG: N-succinylarginine dihydrolase [Fibrobacteria bacterium]